MADFVTVEEPEEPALPARITNPFLPRGRVRRTDFIIWIVLLNVLAYAVVALFPDNTIAVAASAVLLWPIVMIMIQRVHDFGSSGLLAVFTAALLMVLIGLRIYLESSRAMHDALVIVGFALNLAGLGLVLMMILRAGTVGSNEYGRDPRGRGDAEAVNV